MNSANCSQALTNDPWWMAAPVIEQHGDVLVVRDDLIEGGAKMRFLPYLVEDAKEIVYGGPFCGGAPYAISVWARRMGVNATLFYAKRKNLHWRQKAAFENGAKIYQVPAGRMSVVQKRARDYAKAHDALFLPLGFDVPEANRPFEAAMRSVRETVGRVPEVWCAAGSGMLARCLGRAFPDATIKAVGVGLASRHNAQDFSSNVEMIESPYRFEDMANSKPPFPACGNYEGKAWEIMQQAHASGALFWNVMRADKPPAPAPASL